uniref:DNA primase n=1 Tax=Desulfomonile tiedjei TaxID=2358 RepID=A0A7C4EV93_9BACT
MRIPQAKISEIAAAADIVQVISQYVALKRAGKDYKGVCPFHGDKDPSFYVSPQKGIFHCFGCSVGGSVFNFLMRIENWTFVAAVQYLAKKYGIHLDLTEAHGGKEEDRKAILQALRLAGEYFSTHLVGEARTYLADRGISDTWIKELGLGFAPDKWDGMVFFLRSRGVPDRHARAAGLVRERADGSHYDYFRQRIMIPIRNINGQIVAYGGRILGEGTPKYLNSPESEVFTKKNTLFGLDAAREAIRKEGYVILVEGYFDQISLRTHGIDHVVAPLGTSLAQEQVRLIKRFTSNVRIVFDSDEAGIRALKRAIPMFLGQGIEPSCVLLQGAKDPDEAIQQHGTEKFKKLVEDAIPAIDFFLEHIESRCDVNTIKGKNLAIEEIMPIIGEIADSVERDYIIEKVCSRFRIKEERLRQFLRTSAARSAGLSRVERGLGLYNFPADERNVVRGMILLEGVIDAIEAAGALKDIEDPVLAELAAKATAFHRQNGRFDSKAFLHSLEDERLSSIVASWMNPRPEEDDLRPELDGDTLVYESLDRMRRRKLEKRKSEIKERMKKCIPGDDEYKQLATELMSLGRVLHK